MTYLCRSARYPSQMNRNFVIIILCTVGFLIALRTVAFRSNASAALDTMQEYVLENDLLNHGWRDEEAVTIRGYTDDAMEIGISADGEYMLFNDRGVPNKDMHWAERIDERTYQYKGRVKNTVTPVVDGTPSFDASGNLYFTTLKSYPKDSKSIYISRFEDGTATSPQPIEGNIYIIGRNRPNREMWISLDPDVSDDARFLFYSEGRFSPRGAFPYPFKVRGAEKIDGKFIRMEECILENINTDNLEYAPAISSDGLELFFTRIGKIRGRPRYLGIYTARRESTNSRFSKPERIVAITGEVEAPVLSGDGKHLYYHRMDDGLFKVYRVTRKN